MSIQPTDSDLRLRSTREAESPTKSKSTIDYIALALSTWGVGYFPLAPGTWGSIVGVVIFWLLATAVRGPIDFVLAVQAVAIVIITFLGIWAASRVEVLMGRKDPGRVVVDEVAGQMISLLPLVWFSRFHSITWIIVSFILFRFFDIVKPYPARKCEALHGGLGIMADDLVAGVYGAIVTAALVMIF